MTKAQLKEYKEIQKERDALAEQLAALEAVLYGPKAQRLDGMPRSGSGGGSQLENLADRHMELRRQYEAKVAELTARLEEIEQAITVLEPRERAIIRLHYFQGYTWEQVAVEMCYTWRHVHRIHGKALERLRDI